MGERRKPRTPGQGWPGWTAREAGMAKREVRAIERVRGLFAHPGGNSVRVREEIAQPMNTIR